MFATTCADGDETAFGSLSRLTTVAMSGVGNRRARTSSTPALLLCAASVSSEATFCGLRCVANRDTADRCSLPSAIIGRMTGN